MPERDLLILGDPLLHEKSPAIEDPASTEIAGVIDDLSATLAAFRKRTGFGRGIAAPQVGHLKRVVFIRIPDGFTSALINPVIAWQSAETMELWDDCFSLPELMVRVTRSRAIRVNYLDERGASHTLSAEGDLSELLQHEIDHLDGILATDRAASMRDLCSRQEWLRRYARSA